MSIILMVIFISAIFLSMIKSFLMAIFLAGIFSALTRPIYLWLTRLLKGRYRLASILTLLFIVLVVLIPLALLTGVVTSEAIRVSQTAVPWVRTQLSQPGVITETLASIYFQQKNFDKALDAYKKLSLKYPEKSVYFAGRIEEIELLKNNN